MSRCHCPDMLLAVLRSSHSVLQGLGFAVAKLLSFSIAVHPLNDGLQHNMGLVLASEGELEATNIDTKNVRSGRRSV
jgi:hypothetical protein